MSTTNENLNVNVGADVESANAKIKQLSGTLEGLGATATGLAGLIGGAFAGIQIGDAIGGFIKDSVNEALKAEKAFARLETTLDNIGRQDVFTRLSASAGDLAAQFKFIDNDDIAGVFEKLITFGKLTEQQIRQLTPVIIDFAAKQRIELPAAADAIIRALEGQSRALKTYGIDMKEAKSTTEAFGIIIDELKPKVDGAADTFGKTTAGSIAIAEQKIKDLKEEIGIGLLPTVQSTYEAVANLVDKFNALKSLSFGDRLKFAFGELTGSKTSVNLDKIVALQKIKAPALQQRSLADAVNPGNSNSVLGSGDPNELFNPPAPKKIKTKVAKTIKVINDEFKANVGKIDYASLFQIEGTDAEERLSKIIESQLSTGFEKATKTAGEVRGGIVIPLSIDAQNGLDNLKQLEEKTQKATEAFNEFLAPAIDTVFESLGNGSSIFKALGQSLKALVAQLAIAVIKAAALALILTIVGGGSAKIGGDVFKGFGSIFKKLLNIPKFATGGIVTGPTFGLIGEAGPEAVIPLNALSKIMNSSGGGNPTFVVSNSIHMDELVTQIRKTNQRQARSYGF